ncbi:helix-turn-helix domain-containing protein [Vagococcus elongatus]|uniref:Transcriptional regulator n=1 Tax=Vagococcus elongatus TaxID=180344 RepID=A0A430AV05_9ENTE|nr:helix-turn-helix transcriptional regulator [Vagococcus elongatus]RSU11881.1 transcriptional regulator [Vagococcus elongatus]
MFGEKLKELRKEKGISQEQLSELLDVSRQSISRYENGTAQPDFDKLITLSKYFEVSIDSLLDNSMEEASSSTMNTKGSNKISITSVLNGKVSSFYKFVLSPVMWKKGYHPEILLMGVDSHSFWGDNTVALGWYKTREDAEKELKQILNDMSQGKTVYDLQYYVNVKKKGIFDIQVE